MPKLPVLKPTEVVRALQRLGFVVVRSKGSHLQLKKGNLLVTIPIHNKDLKPETLKSILRQAKISIEELEFNR
ncbi:type II toxin-antitoxin system HicA family toxin [bacterium]|nr:type II toxin-antitoxin system HicA family toxin [bacterium]MBU2439483.1 type II toxin-antitoxin system HicA family toxin [bacterium]MBU4046945.1 type II toxin-antitoxin system HicA family toxin [bacterium]